jgi:hypothetical protein
VTPLDLPADVKRRITAKGRHCCAVCLGFVKRAIVEERVGTASRVTAFCHDRRVTTLVSDAVLEDFERVWHFLDDEGEPYESPAARRRRALQAEVDRLRAARRGES